MIVHYIEAKMDYELFMIIHSLGSQEYIQRNEAEFPQYSLKDHGPLQAVGGG